MTVPDQAPFVFASVTSGQVEIFLNDTAAVLKDHPEWRSTLKPSPANSMFIEIDSQRPGEIDALHDRVKASAKIVMPLTTQWYGMREFALEDPDGHVVMFAERVAQQP
jgi:uncharacterized glyoxalase superfamily protein PhnB